MLPHSSSRHDPELWHRRHLVRNRYDIAFSHLSLLFTSSLHITAFVFFSALGLLFSSSSSVLVISLQLVPSVFSVRPRDARDG